MNALVWDEYGALKLAYPCYTMANPLCTRMTTVLPSFGLLEGQVTSGIIDGTHVYDHETVHRFVEEENTYVNYFVWSAMPITLSKMQSTKTRMRGFS